MDLNEPISTAGEPQSSPVDAAATPPSPTPEAAQPIGQLVDLPDFPRCALGKQVEIGGTTGVVTDLVRHSIKLRSADGVTLSYNIHVLRKLYGTAPVPEPTPQRAPTEPAPPPPSSPSSPAKPEVKRNVIARPDFDLPLKPIEDFVNRTDFPKCAFGEHLDFRGYSGVVVELVNRSLKVRSREGATRSYNADGLRKLYGQPQNRG